MIIEDVSSHLNSPGDSHSSKQVTTIDRLHTYNPILYLESLMAKSSKIERSNKNDDLQLTLHDGRSLRIFGTPNKSWFIKSHEIPQSVHII